MTSILPDGSDSNTPHPRESICPDCATPANEHWNECGYYLARLGSTGDRERAARAIAAGDRTGTASGLIAAIASAIAVERKRVLNEARAVVERETDAYPGASPAITSGIWGGFDQWAMGRIEGDL